MLMRIIILSQDETLYLRSSFATVCHPSGLEKLYVNGYIECLLVEKEFSGEI
jgi:hypothetical protein